MQIKIGKSAKRMVVRVSHSKFSAQIRLLDGQRRRFLENGPEVNQWCVERDIQVEYVNRSGEMPTATPEALKNLLEQWKSGKITEAQAMQIRRTMTDDQPCGCVLYFTTEDKAFEYKMKWL